MPSVYKMEHPPEVKEVLEEMRTKMSKQFGITLVGNRCTVRWNMGNHLVDVHMIIENVSTPLESELANEKHDRYEALFAEHPWLREELYYAEEGEHTK